MVRRGMEMCKGVQGRGGWGGEGNGKREEVGACWQVRL